MLEIRNNENFTTINKLVNKFTDEKMTQEKSIRDRYFANEIFKYGEIVEDINTGEQMKILDRGSNYVTVAIGSEVKKKWLNEVREILEAKAEAAITKEPPKDFILLESGQIKMFGHVTANFNRDLSEFILEQFDEFDDLYSKHQIIKCLDYAIQESDMDKAYDLLDKVDMFYTKRNIQSPMIVEGLKTDIERKRLAEIIASVANVRPSKTNYQTVVQSIKALKAKYTMKTQWEVLWPLFKLAMGAGMDGIRQNLPYTFDAPGNTQSVHEEIEDDVIYSVMEENIEMLIDDIHPDDINEAFTEDEKTDLLITEVLSIEDRHKLARKMAQHADYIANRRVRALSKGASSDILMNRARRLAETLVKRRIFHKSASDLTRQEKERFEAGAYKRRALIAKLAQRLVGKVRALQADRIHHTNTPVQHKPVEATAAQVGAS